MAKRYAPRFNFAHYEIESADQTATLKELLDEINTERGLKTPGRQVSIHSLRHILPFLGRLSEREYKSITEPLPLTTIKTIKLLYVENRRLNTSEPEDDSSDKAKSGRKANEKGIHLLDLIEIPSYDKASMESATGTTVAQDAKGREAIDRICSKLAVEISPQKLESSISFFGQKKTRTTSEGVIDYIEYTNDIIHQELTKSIPNDPKALGNAFVELAIFTYRASNYKVNGEAPKALLHEQLYVHLQSLGFVHFAMHHNKFARSTKIAPDKKPTISKQVEDLIAALCDAIGTDVTPNSRSFSTNDVCRIVENHCAHIKLIVEKVTGLPTRSQGLKSDAPRAEKILRSHAFRSLDSIDLDAHNLTLHDIIAALCSFRYQQTARTPYQPKWFGQEMSEGRSTSIHFDKGLKSTKPHVYQGVFQTYYYRFGQYKAALEGRTIIHESWMEFQCARLYAYINILQLRGIYHFHEAACHFDEICTLEAIRIAQRHQP